MDYDNDEVIIDTSKITGKFVIVKDGQFESYEKFDDIPESFDHMVSFMPNPPEVDGHNHEWIELMRELQPEILRRSNRC